MRRHLWLSKELWNELLALSKQVYRDFGYFPSKNMLQMLAKNNGMYSQAQQAVAHRLYEGTLRFLKLKKQGKKCGFPRFRSFDRVKSIYYPQSGFKLGEQFEVSPFGEIAIKQHREIVGEIKTLALKREASGKWFAVFTVEEPSSEPVIHDGESVGIDLGLKTFAALSNGEKIKNPRHLSKWEELLKLRSRQLSLKKKRSRNFKKAVRRLAVVHEKVSNVRRDFLHKLSRELADDYSLIALEDLGSKELAEQNFGKQINDAGWSKFAQMLCYKAESAGGEVVFVNPANTTKTCSCCGNVQPMPLWKRIYECSNCDYIGDRDVNAAKNILARATVGYTGSDACGEDATCLR